MHVAARERFIGHQARQEVDVVGYADDVKVSERRLHARECM